MHEFSFEALGTHWSIVTDSSVLREKEREALLVYINEFDQRFSRFIPESEAVAFRDAKKGEYQISEEFAQMLKTGEKLRSLTNGAYDPAIGKLLEHSGYDAHYRFTANQQEIANYQTPAWSVQGTTLSLEEGIVFDIGGIGKGLCIDLVADFLRSHGHKHFLVDAGGDMFGTTKSDGNAFHIALEWPGKPGVAFGTVELHNAGLAVSDSFRRSWSDWHHIIDPITKEPIKRVIGCAAIAKNAFQADCITSGLFLASKEKHEDITKEFEGEFVLFTEDGKVQVSPGWPGEFFEETKRN